MADLSDFGKSLSDMSEGELNELLRETRLSRRTNNSTTTTTTTKTKYKSKAKAPKIDVSNLSPDLALKLLKQLGEG